MRTPKYSSLLVFVLLGLFVIQAGYNVLEKAPTHDEPNWMTIAWYITHYWTWQGDYHVLMHPPLSFYLHGIPLRLLEAWYKNPSNQPPEGKLAERFPYPYFETFRYDTLFTIAKLAMLPLAVLLGWYVYRWAVQLYGLGAGLFALSLYVFNPYMLAYSTIITSDMAAACCMFFATYHFWKYWLSPSQSNLVLLGITLGLALLSKASAVLLFPIFGILTVGVLLAKNQSPVLFQTGASESESRAVSQTSFQTIGKWLIGLGIAVCIALIILEAGYLFDIQPVRSFRPEQTSDLVYRWFKDIPIPFGAFINGIRLQQSFFFWMVRQHFLAGRVATHPFWYYHIVTLLLKNPIPLTVFLLLSVVWWKGTKKQLIVRESFLVIPAVFVFFYFSFFFPITQDSRFVLPFYPFLFVFVSRIVTFDLFRKTSARIVLGVLMLWYVVSIVAETPHYLEYCNEWIGGTKNGYHWFAATSFDSGQDIKGLGRYMQQHKIPLVKLAYHGKAIPEYYGVRYIPLLEPEGCQPTNGLIAIGTTCLQGLHEQNHHCYDWLKQYEPVDKIGYTIFVYSIP
jgi:hypothetical protein